LGSPGLPLQPANKDMPKQNRIVAGCLELIGLIAYLSSLIRLSQLLPSIFRDYPTHMIFIRYRNRQRHTSHRIQPIAARLEDLPMF
jgi:hypothetical protein